MGTRTYLASIALLLCSLVACSPVDIQPDEAEAFAAKDYRYYMWHTVPVTHENGRSKPGRPLDPSVRAAVDATLQDKGYTLDPQRAQFTVGYRYGSGIRQGVSGDEASNLTYHPPTTINRKVDQASRDNAIALGGVKETTELQLLLRDAMSQLVVWQVTLTEIVENANQADPESIDQNLRKAIPRALRPLPTVP